MRKYSLDAVSVQKGFFRYILMGYSSSLEKNGCKVVVTNDDNDKYQNQLRKWNFCSVALWLRTKGRRSCEVWRRQFSI